jgi:gliding motility-associated lipoprotein GldB
MALMNCQTLKAMKHYVLAIVIVLFIGCDSKSNTEKEIEKIPVSFKIDRFDVVFSEASIDELPMLKQKYPLFFPEQYSDSIWEQRINDTLQIQLHNEVEKTFPNNSVLEDELTQLFQHIKFYFPAFKSPKVYTTTSDVDYRNKVIVSDSLLIIALDTYLGSEHPFYDGIQKYTVQNMKASQLAPDVASAYAKNLIGRPKKRDLLSQMIYYGKDLYLKDLWLPSVPDSEKIGYTDPQFSWARENEEEMWRYFIENELLYSTDPKLAPRFIAPAPFSKFYLEIDNESPGMTGRYLGWQIVRSFMENNSINVQQLMVLEADEIFRKSKYKPNKS